MASTITADNGVSSGSAGLKSSADSSGVLALASGTGTTAVTIDASQNVGIGTSSPTSGMKTDIAGYVGSSFNGASNDSVVGSYSFINTNASASANPVRATIAGGRENSAWGAYLAFSTSTGTAAATEKMRLDTSGNLLVGTTSTVNPGGVTGTASFKTASSSKWVGAFENSASSSPWGVGVYFSGAAPNGTSNAFFYGTDTGGDRFFMRSNGGLANYSANNANLSDERTKTDIQDAGSYLAKICAIPVRTFKYKDQTDDLLNLGVIAQEVEAIAPELVDVSGFGETPEDGIPLKAIYQTDLQYALMKCIQEQQALITTLTERITALEAK